MRRTTVKLPDDLDARLRHDAQRRGTTVSELTREAIEAHLGGARRSFLAAGPVAPGDWLRIAELVAAYRDLPLGTVDASVAAAERLGIPQVATLDRRHLSIVRPAGRPFDLLP
jgi:uncharacterized protein